MRAPKGCPRKTVPSSNAKTALIVMVAKSCSLPTGRSTVFSAAPIVCCGSLKSGLAPQQSPGSEVTVRDRTRGESRRHLSGNPCLEQKRRTRARRPRRRRHHSEARIPMGIGSKKTAHVTVGDYLALKPSSFPKNAGIPPLRYPTCLPCSLPSLPSTTKVGKPDTLNSSCRAAFAFFNSTV